MTTLLIADHANASLKDATHKAVTAAKALGSAVHVLVAGLNCRPAAEAAARIEGVEKVLLADAAPYDHMLAEPTAALIVSLAGPYDAVVAPATTTGKNVMPRVAALLDPEPSAGLWPPASAHLAVAAATATVGTAASALSNSPRSRRMPPCPACALFMETMLYRGMAPFCASAAQAGSRHAWRELSSNNANHAPKED